MAPQNKKEVGVKLMPKDKSVDSFNLDMLKRWGKHTAAPLAAPSGILMAGLSPKRNMADEAQRIWDGYPDAALDAPTFSTVLGDMGVEDSKERAAVGLAGDMILDPTTLIGLGVKGATGGAKTVYPSLATYFTRKTADKVRKNGVKKFIERNIKQKDVDRGLIGPLTKFVQNENMYSELDDAEKLREKISGMTKMDDGLESLNILKTTKERGMIGEAGEKIADTVKQAQTRSPSIKINRHGIVKKLVGKQEAKNTTAGVDPIDLDKYEHGLTKNLNSQVERKVTRLPRESQKTPLLPIKDIEEEIFKAEEALKEAQREAKNTLNKDKAEYLFSTKEVEGVNTSLARDQEKVRMAEKKAFEALQKGREAERRTAEALRKEQAGEINNTRKSELSHIDKENKSIAKANSSLEEQIVALKDDLKTKNSRVVPIDPLPEPKKKAGLPDYPAKEKADIAIHNKKADASLKTYMRKESLPSSKELKAAIAGAESKRRIPLDPADVPPEVTPEMMGSLPPEWSQVPNKISSDEILSMPKMDASHPPMLPEESVNMSLEELIAKKQDAMNQRSGAKMANQDIIKKNQAASMIENQPDVTYMEDQYSSLTELEDLKEEINGQLKEVYKRKNEPDFGLKETRLLDQKKAIDDALMEELNKIELREGNAGLIYKQSTNKYGLLKDLDRLLKPVESAGRKEATDSRWAARVGGAATAGITTHMAGGNPAMTALSVAAGATGADVTRKFVEAGPEKMALWGDRMYNPDVAQAATQLGQKAYTEMNRDTHSIPMIDEGDLDFSMMDRSPDSVEEIPDSGEATDIMAPQPQPQGQPQVDPISQKMDHVLQPEKALWDPYINEAVLNTFLPRNSERILANPTALMAKMQQVAPQQVPILQEMLDKDPESLKEAGPKLAMMFPALFEKDKYGMFDGKIADPQMQQKFLSDLSQDEEMDSIEKAGIAMNLQRGESIHS